MKKRILLIDNNEQMRNEIHAALSAHFEVVTAASLKVVGEFLGTDGFGLIIVDETVDTHNDGIVWAKEMDGKLPIILLSMKGETEQRFLTRHLNVSVVDKVGDNFLNELLMKCQEVLKK